MDTGSEMDLSGWDYAWNPVPIHDFDIGDENTCESKEPIRELLLQYSELFHTEGRRMGEAKVTPFTTKLIPGTKPQFRHQYRRRPKEAAKVQRQIADMLQRGVIRRSRSLWCSPINLAKKDGGSAWRLCSDLRRVNSVTVPDRFPLSRVDDCLQFLAGAKYITTMHLQN